MDILGKHGVIEQSSRCDPADRCDARLALEGRGAPDDVDGFLAAHRRPALKHPDRLAQREVEQHAGRKAVRLPERLRCARLTQHVERVDALGVDRDVVRKVDEARARAVHGTPIVAKGDQKE